MELLIIILLFLICLILFAVEVFLLPGLGLAGVLSAGCLIAGNVLVFWRYGLSAGLWILLASVMVSVALLYWVAHSQTIDKLSLHKAITSTAATSEQLSVSVGDTGIATTRLALIGNALIAGKTVEVRSAEGFLDEGTPLVVTQVDQAIILVRKGEPS